MSIYREAANIELIFDEDKKDEYSASDFNEIFAFKLNKWYSKRFIIYSVFIDKEFADYYIIYDNNDNKYFDSYIDKTYNYKELLTALNFFTIEDVKAAQLKKCNIFTRVVNFIKNKSYFKYVNKNYQINFEKYYINKSEELEKYKNNILKQLNA